MDFRIFDGSFMDFILLLPLFAPFSGGLVPSPGGMAQARDGLVNTKWECMVGQDCVDRLRFRTGGKVLSYSCELGEQEFTWRYGRDSVKVGDALSLVCNYFPESCRTMKAEKAESCVCDVRGQMDSSIFG
jgi:hypothetical protein